MIDPISVIGTAVLGDLVRRVISGAVKWAKMRKRPPKEVVDQKLAELADEHLSESIPDEKREAAVASVVELARPTFDEIVQYSPNTARIISAAKKVVVKKAVAKKAVKGKAFKKSAPVKYMVKKSATVTKAAKKAVAKKAAKKAPAKKMARRR